ncbi:MAG: hypothetical protein CMJ65_16370 [Planctomycetaceae bacterium]|nr:hypothetical protein [Planctomycetaceae bacterium]
MNAPSLQRRGTWIVAGCLLLLVIGIWWQSSGPQPPDPVPPLSGTGSGDSNDSATWVGSGSCSECHLDQANDHAASSHTRALATINLDREPPDSDFFHAASGRRYRVYRNEGAFRHRESVYDADDRELVLSDHVLTHVVGTGHQGRTYLIEDDGFLIQSPITWYTSRNRWQLAPGYDRADHSSFERPIPVDCLNCHAGRSESRQGAYHRVAIHEQTIGCERCHGPGSRHVEQRNATVLESGQADPTIVQPGRLSRERLESICAQCHLQNNAASNIRGRQLTGYRPGQRLAEHRAHFVLDNSQAAMTVVGHVEQLHKSRCYTATKTLTCTTCHDPHHSITSRVEADDVYRAKCLQCHQPQACGLPASGPRRREARDRCASCHMPQTITEIPHVASTHHRVGIHDSDNTADSPQRPSTPGRLVPLYDLSHLSTLDQDRCRGLAYRQLASKQSDPELASKFRLRARQTLQEVRKAGIDDAELLAALADLVQASDPEGAGQLAKLALEHDKDLTPQDRVNALAVLANSHIGARRPGDAIPILERLVTLHRHPGAWLQLGQCRLATNDTPGALEAIEQAVRISPQRPRFQELLARLYRDAGRADDALRHEKIAAALRQPRRNR